MKNLHLISELMQRVMSFDSEDFKVTFRTTGIATAVYANDVPMVIDNEQLTYQKVAEIISEVEQLSKEVCHA